MPAATPARSSGACAGVAAAMTKPSMPRASRASTSAATLDAQARRPRARAASGSASATTTSSTPARPLRVAAWNAPIRPTPASPIRMRRPSRRCRGATVARDARPRLLHVSLPAAGRVKSLLGHSHVADITYRAPPGYSAPRGHAARACQIDRSTPGAAVPPARRAAERRRSTTASSSPGDPFENEVALADRLGLSRPTVRRAIAGAGRPGPAGAPPRPRHDGREPQGAPPGRADQPVRRPRPRGRGTPRPRSSTARAASQDERAAAGARPAARHAPAARSSGCAAPATTRSRCMRNWLPPGLRRHHPRRARARAACTPCCAPAASAPSSPASASAPGCRPPPSAAPAASAGSEPVLTMTRSAFDAAGEPVEFGDHCYRADDLHHRRHGRRALTRAAGAGRGMTRLQGLPRR